MKRDLFSIIPALFSVIPALFSVIPAKAGIQTGGLTAKAPRRKEDFRVLATAALFVGLGSVAAGALNWATPWRLGALAVESAAVPR